MTPIKAEDGKEYYVVYMRSWVYESLNPWPDLYKAARRHLASIGA